KADQQVSASESAGEPAVELRFCDLEFFSSHRAENQGSASLRSNCRVRLKSFEHSQRFGPFGGVCGERCKTRKKQFVRRLRLGKLNRFLVEIQCFSIFLVRECDCGCGPAKADIMFTSRPSSKRFGCFPYSACTNGRHTKRRNRIRIRRVLPQNLSPPRQ